MTTPSGLLLGLSFQVFCRFEVFSGQIRTFICAGHCYFSQEPLLFLSACLVSVGGKGKGWSSVLPTVQNTPPGRCVNLCTQQTDTVHGCLRKFWENKYAEEIKFQTEKIWFRSLQKKPQKSALQEAVKNHSLCDVLDFNKLMCIADGNDSSYIC